VGGALLTIRALCRPRFTVDYCHVGGVAELEANVLDRRSLKVMLTTERELDVALVSGGHHTHRKIAESAT
jgi:hypothetical protein